jgi:signal transduction histidine kinase
VLRNLISNAIKFSPAGESITISTTETKDFVSITVADRGIGMTEKEVGKLFNVNSLTPAT